MLFIGQTAVFSWLKLANCLVIGQTAVLVAGHSVKLFHAVAVIGHGTKGTSLKILLSTSSK